ALAHQPNHGGSEDAMLRTVTRIALAVGTLVAAVGAAILIESPAYADVICPPDGGPCYVIASTPGHGGGGGAPGGGTRPVGALQCRYKNESPVPCYDPTMGWYNNEDGCYYNVDTATNNLLGRPGNYDVWCGPGPIGACVPGFVGSLTCYVFIGSLFFATPPP